MRALASIAVVPVLFVGWQLWSDHSFEQRLAPIASGIAGLSVEVDCQSVFGALIDAQGREGEVLFEADGTPRRKLFLTRKVCSRLRAFAGVHTHSELDCLRAIDWRAPDPLAASPECYARSSNTVYAILILAHESYHTAGSRDEAETNCLAIQAMAWTAMQLGAPQGDAELRRARDGGARACPGTGVRDERLPSRPPARSPPRDGRLPDRAPDRRSARAQAVAPQ